MAKRGSDAKVAAEPVEFQMRFRKIIERASNVDTPADRGAIGPFVAVSRQAASGGARVARLVGERLGWTVLDRELVKELAGRLELKPEILGLMDETRSNWFSDTLLNLMNSRLVLQKSYVAMAGKVMALTAYHEPVVVVGRAANLILPRSQGLSVRIIAPKAFRIDEIKRSEELADRAADSRVDELDRGRRDFIDRHFDRDIDDTELYDLVVDTASFGIDGAASLIVSALELRGLQRIGDAPRKTC